MSASAGPLGMSREQSEQLAASLDASAARMQAAAQAFAEAFRPAAEEFARRMTEFQESLRRGLEQRRE